MRTRDYDWFDSVNFTNHYSFQVHHEGVWKNIAEDEKPCIFSTTEERDAKRAEYRKKKSL